MQQRPVEIRENELVPRVTDFFIMLFSLFVCLHISVLRARIATLDTALDSPDPGLFGNVSFVAIRARAAEQHQILAAMILKRK